jgi:hypothetical protein
MFVEIDGKIFNTDQIAAVIPIDDDHCYILPAGGSIIDGGIIINLSIKEVEEDLADEGNMLELADRLQAEIDSSKSNRKEK